MGPFGSGTRRTPDEADPGMDDALAVMRVIEAIIVRKPNGVTQM